MNKLKEHIARRKPIETGPNVDLGFDGILKHIPPYGLILEFGVFAGNSLNQICHLVSPRVVYGFDWFHGLPESWIDQGRMSTPQGAFTRHGVPPQVRDNACLVVGRVEDTVPNFVSFSSERVLAFAHFDLDLYAPTKATLMALQPLYREGTVLLFDEYDTRAFGLEHEQRAFKEFLDATGWRAELIGKRVWNAWAFKLIV